MTIALIDNGSLEPAAQLNLRRVAAELAARVGRPVEPVSWKHSDRIAPAALGGTPAWTLTPWVRAQLARGEHEFVLVPFFVSAQGAIGSALRRDLHALQHEAYDFAYVFSPGIARGGDIAGMLADHIRATAAARQLSRPTVVVVDHGGPSFDSATLRDEITSETRRQLGADFRAVVAASMEGDEPHNRPLLADQLGAGDCDRDVVVAQLFLAPGRHAGLNGDLPRICRAAEARLPGLHCHLTPLLGTHPRVIDALASGLQSTLSTFHASTAA